MKAVSALCLSLFLFTLGADRAGAAPSVVYSTYLPGVLDLAVDSAGSAYVLGFRGNPSGYFVAKLSPAGELIFQRPLDLPPREPTDPPREPSHIAVDPAGSIYIAGYANYGYYCERGETCEGSDWSNVGFVAKLGPDGTGLLYDTYFWDGVNTQAVDLAVDPLGRAHVHYTSRWPDKYGYNESGGMSFGPSGSRVGYFGFPGHDADYGIYWGYATAVAMGPSGDLFGVGWRWPWDYYSSNGEYRYPSTYFQRRNASTGAAVEIALDPTIHPLNVAGAPGGGSVVVGRVGEFEDPGPGSHVDPGRPKDGDLYIAELGPAGETIFSRVLSLGAVEVFDVAVTSSGQIVLVVGPWGGTWPSSSPYVLWLESGTGEVLSSTPGRLVAVGPGDDVYVVSNGYVSRLTENRPPDCSRSTASPSVIWPPNGKMVPVAILGVTDPEGGPVALKVTGLTQDEPGAAFSGIGSSVAQVKAERDGKGDGRVYRLAFQATDSSGASCTGQVTVCVPHDGGKGSCVDSSR